MSLNPGDRRVALTYNPDNYYITPDVPLRKSGDPSHIHELARVSDAVVDKQYKGVVFVGNVLPENFLEDTGNSRFAGYLGAPFEKLSDAYIAAQSRYGTPSSTNRVLVLLVGASVEETTSIHLNNPYIDIHGIGRSSVHNSSDEVPLFTSSGANGITVKGLTLSAHNAPILKYPSDCVLTDSITFEECNLVDELTESPVLSGLIQSDASVPPTVFRRCFINSGLRPFYFHNSNSDVVAFEIYNSDIETGNSQYWFLSQKFLRFRVSDSLLKSGSDLGLCSSISLSGVGEAHVSDTRVEGSVTLRWFENCRTGHFDLSGVYCEPSSLISCVVSSGASLQGSILNTFLSSLECINPQMRVQNFKVENVQGNLKFTVNTLSNSCHFQGLVTSDPLDSTSDQSAVVSSNGTVSGSFYDCYSTYRLINTLTSGVFCGRIQGGSSYGIGRCASLMAPVRQSVIRDHVLLKKGFPEGASSFTSHHYPDLLIAGTLDQDDESPVILQGVRSDGIIDVEVPDMEDTPKRQVFMSDCSFTNREGVVQALFPSITPNLHASAEGRIFIAGVARFPAEDGSSRLVVDRSMLMAEGVSSRFGDLWLGSSLHRTVIDGSSYYITNPRSFREQLGIFYVIFYCRIAGGTTEIELTHPKFSSATLLNFTAETGLSEERIDILENYLPARYSYIGDNTIRITIPEPEIGCSHLDFAVQMGNDLAEVFDDLGGSNAYVREGYAYVDQGSAYVDIAFSPVFAEIPSLVGDLTVLKPTSSDTDLYATLDHSSISASGFRVYLNAAPSVGGYKIKWRARL